MPRYFLPLIFAISAATGAESLYQLSGRVVPPAELAITIFGATSPFNAAALSDSSGRFTFKKLPAGTYTIAVFHPGFGEARRTIEVGPGTADRHQRVSVALEFKPGDFALGPALRRDSVSTRELSISEKSQRDYEDARKALSHRDAAAAVNKLQQAVEASPQFSAAWNLLGTISYQTQKFDQAEQYFRRALAADPHAFEPLVNLGGVLVTLGRTQEALEYNRNAVVMRPNDALANSQLGECYFQGGDYHQALKYLGIARRIDPAHFSHPQLVMAEIHARLGDRKAAADDLKDFLAHHPDWPAAAQMRDAIAQWEK